MGKLINAILDSNGDVFIARQQGPTLAAELRGMVEEMTGLAGEVNRLSVAATKREMMISRLEHMVEGRGKSILVQMNTERLLRDEIGDLQHQVGVLKKTEEDQANKIRDLVKSNHAHLENEQYAAQKIAILEEHVSRLDLVDRNQSNAISGFATEKKALVDYNSTLGREIASLEAKLAQMQKLHINQADTISRYQKENKDLLDDVGYLRNDVDSLNQDNADLRVETNSYRSLYNAGLQLGKDGDPVSRPTPEAVGIGLSVENGTVTILCSLPGSPDHMKELVKLPLWAFNAFCTAYVGSVEK